MYDEIYCWKKLSFSQAMNKIYITQKLGFCKKSVFDLLEKVLI